jgi:hypothetical protein
MKARLVAFVAAIAVAAAAVPVIGHHSFAAEFDSNQPFEFTGVVTKVEWKNPHTYFFMDIKDEKTGEVVNWGMEMGSPNGLMRNGWTRNSMKVGDVVTVEGSKAKDGSPTGNARSVVLSASGKRLFAGSSQGVTP